ncbi:homeobox-leucine zipper protein ATHB-6-like, partial [Macadamia integrifolia]|uniref:homeobox-leucine zipper protein ATHB-6-like n=1 Tax=Macadamia integrifolia TaxID=60698 RepID=UPI001C4EE6C3
NRQARWKTKQLERDYGVLKFKYEYLKLNFDSIQQDKESLLAKIKELEPKLEEDNIESNALAAKEDILISESVDNKVTEQQSQISTAAAELGGSETLELNQDCCNNTTYGSSHSYSTTILNEDNSPNAVISSSGVFQQHQLMMSRASSSLRFNISSRSSLSPTSLNSFQFSDLRLISSTS